MPAIKTVQDLFIDELRIAYDAEKQWSKALRRMARAARNEALVAAFSQHVEQTKEHISQLKTTFAIAEQKARGRESLGIAGLIGESRRAMEDVKKSAIRDLALLAIAERAEHYEIATYARLIALANSLELGDAVVNLQGILAQEVATARLLDTLGTAMLTAMEKPQS